MQRGRPSQEFGETQSEAGQRIVTVDSPIGGYNGYTSPDLLSPKFWLQSSNVYAGQFGSIRRARFAPVINTSTVGYTPTGQRIVSMFGYAPPLIPPTTIFDNPQPRAWQQAGMAVLNYTGTNYVGIYAPGNGPFSRVAFPGFILEANGVSRTRILPNAGGVPTQFAMQAWGINLPDASPQVTINAGSTKTIVASPTGAVRANNTVTITTTATHGLTAGQYVTISGVTDTTFNSAAGTAYLILSVPSGTSFTFSQIGSPATSGAGTVTFGITKTVGRSYAYAWEDASTGNVTGPSPATQYIKYTGQVGVIDCIQQGTITIPASTVVTGTGTAFSSAWVGYALFAEGGGFIGTITSVTNPTNMVVTPASVSVLTNVRFQVVPPNVLFLRLYATGDGASVYFLIARNQLSGNSTVAGAGFEFNDTAQSEPPNAPFSNEISQIYNIPPPVGTFLDQYQGRVILYGVTGALQTFFYSNIENTVIGQPPECFSPLNTVILPIGDGQIFGSANLPTGFILWSNRQDMFKMTGLLSDNNVANAEQLGATIQRLPYKIGCASPYAVAVTPLGVIWLSSDREVWLFTDNYAPKNIGKPIQDLLNRINGSRLAFAKMSYYKRGERSWLELAVALDSSTFNNKLLILDLDLLSSNGQPSFFTFDMATNAPTWYQYDVNCEALCTSYDSNSINHSLVGDVDLITDIDYQPGYYTIGSEQFVSGSVILHAFGNEDAHMVKTFDWMRALTNQVPKNLAAQGWQWAVYSYDDDSFIIGVNANPTTLIPGVDSTANPLFLEYSPAKFVFGGFRPIKGRRFQIGTTFPTAPGLFELRGYQLAYTNVVGR